MSPSRSVVIAGAGIGGLTAALALARRGFDAAVLEQVDRLEEAGAGIQLSPNASRVLIALGLGERLAPHVVVPQELRIMAARSGRVLAQTPLGETARRRYGAPYWVIHRGDLQAVLLDAARSAGAIKLHLGTRVQAFAAQTDGIIVAARHHSQIIETHGRALVAADGLWSSLRGLLGHRDVPRFAGHAAWRALIRADDVAARWREPIVNLWLGCNGHLVHYPVKGGRLINIVAIMRDGCREAGWSAPGQRADILSRFAGATWHAVARDLLAVPEQWQKWGLHDRAPSSQWGSGPATLLGDAAHPALPYLAQGAAMAIEDAAVLAACLASTPDDTNGALRHYEQQRQARTARMQRAARRNGYIYHVGGIGSVLRGWALRGLGGERLLSHHDWLYGWRPS